MFLAPPLSLFKPCLSLRFDCLVMDLSPDCPRALLCPYEAEDPAFRPSGRLPNLRYGDQVRAIWVTRFEFHSDQDIVRIMQQSAQAGFNTVFFQVRGNATTYYPSKLEPWSEVYGWKNPGFDPLRLAITEAHTHNMALHAWVNVMPMWRGSHPPLDPEHIYNSRPEWSWYNRQIERQPLNRGFYVSINPCLPEARWHIVRVCREIVSCYNVDGLHLDYIRFPNEPPVVNGKDYSRDKRTLELFHADTGATPDKDPQLWDQWRCDCVTALLRDIRRTVKSLRPQLVLTAAVGAERKQALSKFQDVDQWWKERLLDAVVPMNYTGCHEIFRSRVERDWQEDTAKASIPLYKKLQREKLRVKYLQKHGPVQQVSADDLTEWARPPEPAVIMGTSLEFGDSYLHQKQLSLALQRFGHFSVFCYSSLFGLGKEGVFNKHRLLFPFLKILADAAHLFSPLDGHMERHPFRARYSLAHPEEAFPYDQLHIYDQVPAGLAFRPSKEDKFKLRKWGGKKGSRCIVADDGDRIKLNRRTLRRNLRMKQLRKDSLVGETLKKQPLSNQSRVSQTPALGLEKTVEYMPMKNWEAVKMSEATEREENDFGAAAATEGFHFKQRKESQSESVKRVSGGALSDGLLVRIRQVETKVSTPFCCISTSHTNQHTLHFKIGWEFTHNLSRLTQRARRLFD